MEDLLIRDKPLSQQLRPESLDEFVGQEPAKNLIKSMKSTGLISDHLLLVGPPGLGKTSLARIIGAGSTIHPTIGGHLRRDRDLEVILMTLIENEILFIDEIHAAKPSVLELLYLAMEEGKVSGKWEEFDLPESFRIVGSTTSPGKLSQPFRDRFGHIIFLDYYSQPELVEIIRRAAKVLELRLKPAQIEDVAKRSRGVPRVATKLLKRIADFGAADLEKVWMVLEIDDHGLSALDRSYLRALSQTRPMGKDQLARKVGVDSVTLEQIVESFLTRIGFVEIVTGGRRLTMRGWRHLIDHSA